MWQFLALPMSGCLRDCVAWTPACWIGSFIQRRHQIDQGVPEPPGARRQWVRSSRIPRYCMLRPRHHAHHM